MLLRNKYNLVQILHIYCPLEKEVQSFENLVHICTFEKEVQSRANLEHLLCIGERSTIFRKSCAYIAHRRKKYNLAQILCIYCALEK